MSASRVRDLCLAPWSVSEKRTLAKFMSHKPQKQTQSYHQAVWGGGVEVSTGSDMATCLLLRCSEEILGWFSLVTLTLEQLKRRRGDNNNCGYHSGQYCCTSSLLQGLGFIVILCSFLNSEPYWRCAINCVSWCFASEINAACYLMKNYFSGT